MITYKFKVSHHSINCLFNNIAESSVSYLKSVSQSVTASLANSFIGLHSDRFSIKILSSKLGSRLCFIVRNTCKYVK